MKFFLLLLLCWSMPVVAEPLLTEKRSFSSDNFRTFSGQRIPRIDVGWQSYGTLSPARDNVILITHFFSGSSHAAGKYQPDDDTTGYWDAIIGPGKAIDTNQFFVISVDTLVNLNVHHPKVITTGPATINPETNQPYGLDFPVVTIRDFVEVQRLVLESLGIKRLHAVMGASLGSLQALEWATVYPERVERLISVIGAAEMDAWTVSALEHWATPIRLDANWQQGNYYDAEPPTEGLVAALALMTQQATHPSFFNQSPVQHQAMDQAALASIHTAPAIVSWLRDYAKERARYADANHLLYLVRASQLYVAGQQGPLLDAIQQIQARTLVIAAKEDVILLPYLAKELHQSLDSSGKASTMLWLDGQLGHLDGIAHIAQAEAALRTFLEE